MKHLMSCELKYSADLSSRFKKNGNAIKLNSSNVEFCREMSSAEILYRSLDIRTGHKPQSSSYIDERYSSVLA
jgi:hypothetical protein